MRNAETFEYVESSEGKTHPSGPGRKMGKNRVLSSAPVKYWVCGHHRKRHENSIRKAAAQWSVDAQIHILHAVEAHIGCHPQDMHMHTSELKSGRLQTCLHRPQNLCSKCGACCWPHTHWGTTSLAGCCVPRYPYSSKVPHLPFFLPAAIGTCTQLLLSKRRAFFQH